MDGSFDQGIRTPRRVVLASVPVGILYMAAALLVVPALLVLFHRLSRTPPTPKAAPEPMELPASLELSDDPAWWDDEVGPGFAGPADSVADEAERWLQSQS